MSRKECLAIMHGDFSGAILVLDTGIPCNNVCDKAAHDVDAHLTSVLQRAADARHRVLLVLSGSATWCQQAVQTWWSAASSRVWIGEREGAETLPISKVKQLLGSEYALVVIDAHAGLSPDALASVAGTVVAGGALIVLTPPWQQWGEAADADYARLASYPHDWHILPARFLQRMRSTLTTCFSHETLIAHIQESEVGLAWTLPATTALQRIASSSDASPARDTVPNHSQQQCLDKLAAHHGTAVLLADRGFGKSALLGFAARQWIAEGKAVCVMAPSRAAAASVFRHAGEGLLFFAPDQIAAHDVVDVLLVAEAAVIPLPALLSTLTRFPRVIFATTVDGYEGTGRGFVLRFLRELDRQCAGWLALQLDAPVRWAQDDPLTRWLYQSLLLDAQEPVLLSPKIEDVAGDVPIMVIEEISQAQLAADNALLVDIYGLLRSAHYRTTPDDLRFLLDAPNVLLYRLQQAGCTVAVVLLVEEG
ncbi:MAG: tRNA(Met) cytidine acetyltransferase, partial [Pseudomonadales bacterium]|nr:tRNA(Met) cytidine acetyltransferase [Pseudomonadales bacterium]